MTSTWETILVAAVSGGVLGSLVSAWLTGRHEHRSWLRGKILEASSEFSSAVQASFGPVGLAIDRVFEEPDADDDDEGNDEDDEHEGNDEDDEDEREARDYWSRETVECYETAKAAMRRAEAALSPLLLLLPEESVPVQAANRALYRLGTALGSLNEVPRDSKVFTDAYVLAAELEWKAFNNSVQRELRRAGRRIPRKLRERERERHKKWVEHEIAKRTTHVEDQLRILG